MDLSPYPTEHLQQMLRDVVDAVGRASEPAKLIEAELRRRAAAEPPRCGDCGCDLAPRALAEVRSE